MVTPPEEDRAKATGICSDCTQNFVTIGPAVPEICSRTETHTQTN